MPAGRPTKYQANYATMAREIMTDGGFSMKKLASVFSVRRETIWDWKRKHPGFSNAIQTGWDIWLEGQTRKTIALLLKGQYYTETIKELGEDGVMRITKKHRKRLLPNPSVAIFSAKNALSMKDERSVTHGGEISHKVEPSDELIDMVADIVSKTKSDS